MKSYSNYSSNTIPLSKYNSEPQNNNLAEPNLNRRPNKSPTLNYPTNEESNDHNLQTTFTSITSTPQRNNGAYLANHQHQVLTRKASIDPYGEANTNLNPNNNNNNNNNKTKLCKTYSDPKARFQNPTQINHIRSQQQQNLFRMISTPYSQQQRQFVSRSPPTSTMDTLTVSPIKKCYSDNEKSNYCGKKKHNTNFFYSILFLFKEDNNNNTNDLENTDDQKHNNTELESFCRQITESAMNDDGKNFN
jgi:hypothetical protein